MTLLPIGISPGNDRLVELARQRGHERGASYAKSNAPTSPMPELTGNVMPEKTTLGWLRNRNKCNQFVGDVLTLAGFKMPTFRMRDGSKHFMHAEALLKQTGFFRNVGRDARPGDILVIDKPGRGENSAHVEIVSAVNTNATSLHTIGALERGVVEQDRSALLRGAEWVERGGYFQRGAIKAFFLRPIKGPSI